MVAALSLAWRVGTPRLRTTSKGRWCQLSRRPRTPTRSRRPGAIARRGSSLSCMRVDGETFLHSRFSEMRHLRDSVLAVVGAQGACLHCVFLEKGSQQTPVLIHEPQIAIGIGWWRCVVVWWVPLVAIQSGTGEGLAHRQARKAFFASGPTNRYSPFPSKLFWVLSVPARGQAGPSRLWGQHHG